MEKVRLDCIKQLLEITERERNHELLLSAKNLQELGVSSFPYIVPVIPCPFPKEFLKGKRFILDDLLKMIPSISSQAGSNQEPRVEFTREALTTFVQPNQSPLAV